MKKYYKYYPRNFTNEFEIYSVEPEQAKEFQEFYDEAINNPNSDIERITRRDAEKYIRKSKVYPFGMPYEKFILAQMEV